jgi:hypothetical protein
LVDVSLPGGPGLIDIIKENLELILMGVAEELPSNGALKPLKKNM